MKDFIKQEYKEFKAPDFALEQSFIDWVKDTDIEAEKFWADWVKNNPDKLEEIELARTLVLAMQFRKEQITNSQINAEWKKFQKNPHRFPANTRDKRNTLIIPLRGIVSVAAAFLLLATFIFIIYSIIHQSVPLKSEPLTLVKETPKGQKLSIVLPDGSEIKLNSDSKIQYPAKFTGDYREVILEGEAFFDIVHNDHAPFKVHTSDVTVMVLGTSFNVNAYPENDEIKVALVEGKVKVNARGGADTVNEFFLNPNEMIEINKINSKHKIQSFNIQEIAGWKDGYLYFEKVDFGQTIAKLERWYGVKFEMDPTVMIDPNWRFNGKFHNKSLEYILRTFSYPDLFKYKIEEQKVIIY